jgi:hypothetical protein
VAQGFNYTNIAATTAGTLIKTGSGVLHAITINQKSATGTDVLNVFDNTSAANPRIATINLATGQDVLLYDVEFNTGLDVSATIAGTADITIMWL